MAKKQMIYCIYKFKEWYEYDESGHIDRFRVGPLKFVKVPVGNGETDGTISFYRLMQTMKGCKNYDTLHTVYYELLELSACQSLAFRGYIYDGAYKPADINTIARLINRDVISTRKAINTLVEIGLIEYVPYVKVKPLKKLRRKFPAETGKQPAGTGNEPPTHSRTANGKGKRQSSKGKRQTGNGKSTKKNKTAKSRNDKAEAAKKSRSRKGKPQTEAANESRKPIDQGHQEEQSAKTSSLPKPMPNMPTESELSQEHTQTAQSESATPGKSVTSEASYEPPLIRNEEDFAQYARQLAPVELKFADEVYAALRCVAHGPADKWPGLREYVTFIEAMRRAVKAGLGVNALNALSEASIKEAKRLGKQRFTKTWTKSCEACWMSTFNKRLLAYKAKKVQRSEGSG